MRIHIPIPSLVPHGGIRVIVAIANGLAKRGHTVYLQPLQQHRGGTEFKFHKNVRVGPLGELPERTLITSPHSIHLARHKKTVVHLQMMEDMFRPNDSAWRSKCFQTYNFPGRLLSISEWGANVLRKWGRNGRIDYIGNGVDFDSFPVAENARKASRPTVLVEGWNAYNPTKDVARLAPRAAHLLRQRGIRVLAYGLQEPADHLDGFDSYYKQPTLEILNQLYAQSWVLLKASVCDARSCSPVEAMTKGTPTLRVIKLGDDDLIHGKNAIRHDYAELQSLGESGVEDLANAVQSMLENVQLQEQLTEGGFEHLRTHCNWDRWLEVIEAALRDPNGDSPLPGALDLFEVTKDFGDNASTAADG